MSFLEKIEFWFYNLQFCYVIESQPLFYRNGKDIFMFDNSMFEELILDFYKSMRNNNSNVPYSSEFEIYNIKSLMISENISNKEALNIIERLKKQYWSSDTINMFRGFSDKIKDGIKKLKPNTSDKKVQQILTAYEKYLLKKRNKLLTDLIEKIENVTQKEQSLSSIIADSDNDRYKKSEY